jgi:hypothetical protein
MIIGLALGGFLMGLGLDGILTTPQATTFVAAAIGAFLVLGTHA